MHPPSSRPPLYRLSSAVRPLSYREHLGLSHLLHLVLHLLVPHLLQQSFLPCLLAALEPRQMAVMTPNSSLKPSQTKPPCRLVKNSPKSGKCSIRAPAHGKRAMSSLSCQTFPPLGSLDVMLHIKPLIRLLCRNIANPLFSS